MKVKLVIEATFELTWEDVKVLRAVTPENQLATARLNNGKVKSTIEAK
jgi:hypothetical protein